jgi:hypothetical protein
MTPPHRDNVAASVRQRLLSRAREQREDFGLLLTRFGTERLLYRLGESEYGASFVLKGAMLFPLWGMDKHRPTRDADLLGFGENTEAHLMEVFQDVCRLAVEDDGLRFDPQSVQAGAIREEMEYGGIRVRLTATLDGARISLQIDVGFGDAVTPAPGEVDYPTLLDLPAPRLRVYPRETVVAEKFQAMVHLGMANSRMKDFYDIWMLARFFEFDGTILARAIERTFERRQTAIPDEVPLPLTAEFYADPAKALQWRAFLGRNDLAEQGTSFETVAVAIERFLMPLCLASHAGNSFASTWPMGGPWRS